MQYCDNVFSTAQRRANKHDVMKKPKYETVSILRVHMWQRGRERDKRGGRKERKGKEENWREQEERKEGRKMGDKEKE